jgi:DNA-binding SARP family transcriptional activator
MTKLIERIESPVVRLLVPRPPRISVLGGFQLAAGDRAVSLAEGSERLLALLALRGRPVKRVQVAGLLWPDASDGRAFACLRSSLARLLGVDRALLSVTATDLQLTGAVHVDIDQSRALAHRLLDTERAVGPADTGPRAIAGLAGELLPGWYDDWVLVESEEWRQLRLHALEALAIRLTVDGRYGDATSAALAAARADPLRESARAVLIRVHLAEHNQSEALREYARYQRLLRAELGLDPTPQLRALLPETPPVTLR